MDLSVNPEIAKKNVEAKGEEHITLVFALHNEDFGVDVKAIREIVRVPPFITRVPNAPEYIRGVINLRGAMVPVIDLSVRFGRPPTEVARRSCVVILEVPRAEGTVVVGVIVENVSEVLELAPSEIEPAPSFGGDIRSEFLSGVGKIGTRFVILLDVNHVLTTDELTALSGDRTAEEAAQ